MNNVYVLGPRRDDDRRFNGYDVYSGFVVVAESEASARALVDRCGDECRHDRNPYGDAPSRCVWHDPDAATCELIGRDSPRAAGVQLSSFHAG